MLRDISTFGGFLKFGSFEDCKNDVEATLVVARFARRVALIGLVKRVMLGPSPGRRQQANQKGRPCIILAWARIHVIARHDAL